MGLFVTLWDSIIAIQSWHSKNPILFIFYTTKEMIIEHKNRDQHAFRTRGADAYATSDIAGLEVEGGPDFV